MSLTWDESLRVWSRRQGNRTDRSGHGGRHIHTVHHAGAPVRRRRYSNALRRFVMHSIPASVQPVLTSGLWRFDAKGGAIALVS